MWKDTLMTWSSSKKVRKFHGLWGVGGGVSSSLTGLSQGSSISQE